jgi:hypothetical protein
MSTAKDARNSWLAIDVASFRKSDHIYIRVKPKNSGFPFQAIVDRNPVFGQDEAAKNN